MLRKNKVIEAYGRLVVSMATGVGGATTMTPAQQGEEEGLDVEERAEEEGMLVVTTAAQGLVVE